MIGQIFHALYQFLLNLLVLFYDYLPGHDFGIAVISLTLFVKLITIPLTNKATKSQKAFNELQPKIKEIQEKYRDDKTEQAKQTMELYQKEKINPLAGFVPLLIQLPVLIALYQVFINGLKPESMSLLYSFIANPGVINPSFLGIVDLSKASTVLAIISGLGQYYQAQMLKAKQPKPGKQQSSKGTGEMFSNIMQKEMQFLLPVLTFFILLKVPSAVALYWAVSIIFSIVQQSLMSRGVKANA